MKKFLKFLPAILAFIILFYLIYPNYRELIYVYKISSKFYLFCSFIAAMMSYIFMSLSLYEMLKIMGYKLDFSTVTGITFISTAVNYFVSTAGASGFAIRTHLLNKRKVPISICITTSVVITAFLYLVLGFIVLQGFILHLFEIRKINNQIIEGLIGSIVIFVIPLVLTLVIYNHKFRNRWAIRIYYFINTVLYNITKYKIPKEDFKEFKQQLNCGIDILHTRKYELHKVLIYILLDWVFNILVLYFAFRSVNVHLSLIHLIIGFSFGMIMTVIPVLPSGLGAMEFVMSSFFNNQGVSLETAIFASLVFRFFYYVIPSIMSFIMFYGLKLVEPEIARDDIKDII